MWFFNTEYVTFIFAFCTNLKGILVFHWVHHRVIFDGINLLNHLIFPGTSLAAKLLRESGVTLFKVREETVRLLGKSDMYIFSPEHPPLTEPARRAIDWAINEKLKSGRISQPCNGALVFLFISAFFKCKILCSKDFILASAYC